MHRSHPSISRRKHLMKEMMEDDYALPTEQQQIVRVVSSRGNNLHEVETAKKEAEENFLVSMPNKFRKSMWVKRGDFLLIEPIEEGDKVKAEICKILTNDHVKEYTKAGIWPEKFAKKPAQEEELPSQNQEDSDFEDDLTPNTNRPQESSEEEEEDEDTSSDED